MIFCVFVQVRKKLKHVEEERLRRHNEAVSSPLILFHVNRPKLYYGFCMVFVFLIKIVMNIIFPLIQLTGCTSRVNS